jgi:hypothetical protein
MDTGVPRQVTAWHAEPAMSDVQRMEERKRAKAERFRGTCRKRLKHFGYPAARDEDNGPGLLLRMDRINQECERGREEPY